MRNGHKGSGFVQIFLAIVAVVAVTAVAVPRYQDFVVRSKMSEAFTIIDHTRSRLTEFYIMQERFPASRIELEALQKDMFTAPEFVDRIEVKGTGEENDVVIEIYFQPEVIPGNGFNDQYLYVAGNTVDGSSTLVQWSCGLQGIDARYMPSRCQGNY